MGGSDAIAAGWNARCHSWRRFGVLRGMPQAADQAALAMEAGLPAQRASNPRIPAVFGTRDAMMAGQEWGMRLGAEIG
jgi:hypothetical protein